MSDFGASFGSSFDPGPTSGDDNFDPSASGGFGSDPFGLGGGGDPSAYGMGSGGWGNTPGVTPSYVTTAQTAQQNQITQQQQNQQQQQQKPQQQNSILDAIKSMFGNVNNAMSPTMLSMAQQAKSMATKGAGWISPGDTTGLTTAPPQGPQNDPGSITGGIPSLGSLPNPGDTTGLTTPQPQGPQNDPGSIAGGGLGSLGDLIHQFYQQYGRNLSPLNMGTTNEAAANVDPTGGNVAAPANLGGATGDFTPPGPIAGSPDLQVGAAQQGPGPQAGDQALNDMQTAPEPTPKPAPAPKKTQSAPAPGGNLQPKPGDANTGSTSSTEAAGRNGQYGPQTGLGGQPWQSNPAFALLDLLQGNFPALMKDLGIQQGVPQNQNQAGAARPPGYGPTPGIQPQLTPKPVQTTPQTAQPTAPLPGQGTGPTTTTAGPLSGGTPSAGATPQGASAAAATGASAQQNLSYIASDGGFSRVGDARNSDISHMDPEFARRMADAGHAYEQQTGQKPTFGVGYRDEASQRAAYARNSAMPGGLAAHPAARPGHSLHQSGRAMDVPSGPFRDWLAQNGQRFGLGNPIHNDPNHFQMQDRARNMYAYNNPGGPPTTAAPRATAATGGDIRSRVSNTLRESGASANASQGIMMNIGEESGWNMGSRGSSGERGLVQFSPTGDEARAYQGYLKQTGQSNTPESQMQFLTGRLKSAYPQTWLKMNAARSPQEAASIFAKEYERPSAFNLARRLARFNNLSYLGQ